jgi:hypothetical protein
MLNDGLYITEPRVQNVHCCDTDILSKYIHVFQSKKQLSNQPQN